MKWIHLWLAMIIAVLTSHASQSIAQEKQDAQVIELPETVVSATRTAESIATIPAAVTVITREEIEAQMTVSRDVGDMLGRLVPGLGLPSQTSSNETQTLRGRKVQVLIDGIPQNAIRDVARNLTTIHPSAIERIEVIPGASAMYGESAAGGVINIITRAPGEGPLSLSTDLGSEFSLTRPGGSFGGYFRQFASGQKGPFDYSLNGSFDHVGGFFDARGDRIPPDPFGQGGLADTNSYNLMGKFGFNFSGQRLQLTVNRFVADQDTNYASDPSVNSFPPGTKKARAREGLRLDDHQGTENTIVSLDYRHPEIFGSQFHAQMYYRDYMTRFGPFDGRSSSLINNIIQSRLESNKVGTRLEVETPLPSFFTVSPTLLWGLDFSDEKTSQPVALFDAAAYDNSGGLDFNKTGERDWVPTIKPRDLGLFAQLEGKITERLVLRAGVRHVNAWVKVPGFTTIVGNAVQGGTLDYSDTLFNAGGVYSFTEAVNAFFNFSQGFSLTDIGLVLRNGSAGASVNTLQLDAQKVNNYELGVRGNWQWIQLGLTGFYNTSRLGTTSAGFGQPVVRAPERVYGFDATVDLRFKDNWRFGGSAGWVEGENDADRNGTYKALNGFRIPPLKLTGYVEYAILPAWNIRLQVLHAGSRARAFNDLGPTAFGGRKVRSYTTVDLISSVKLGPGTLRLGIENLLNNQYYTSVSQLLRTGRNDSYAAARGAVFNVGYTFKY
jgi:iron complex outermembrane receptor protein